MIYSNNFQQLTVLIESSTIFIAVVDYLLKISMNILANLTKINHPLQGNCTQIA